MADMETRMWRFFGLDKQALSERLGDILTLPEATVSLSADDLEVTLTLTAGESALEEAELAVSERLGRYLYSRDGTDLPGRVVTLLKEKQLTLAVAESCTGGLVVAQLTGVPGCSQVFGTGVVSYSCDCKEKLLGVRRDTIKRYGAVSEQTAGEMARGVRTRSGASLGLSITGEAGPQAAEDRPVGTVYIALTDGKRTWVQEWQFGNGSRDRAAIRRAAAAAALDLVRRYLEAYPTVMAGGVHDTRLPEVKKHRLQWRQFVAALFPSRRESRRSRLIKGLAWVLALLLLLGGILWVCVASQAYKNNQSLQERLGQLYWNTGMVDNASALSDEDGEYPAGMDARFRSLYDRNPDVGGWIRIADTTVNFPVMVYADGYYENHNFSGQYSIYGQPYFDEHTLLETNALPHSMTIYGKYARDEQMLTPLLSYRRLAYLKEHPVIEMNTLFVSARWEIFAVMVVDEEENFNYAQTIFADDAAFEAHLAEIDKRALFRSTAAVSADDRILLISVEARQLYGHAGARLVVAARQTVQDRATAEYVYNYQAQMPEGWADNGSAKTTLDDTPISSTTTAALLTTRTVLTATTGAAEEHPMLGTVTESAQTTQTTAESTVTTANTPTTTVRTHSTTGASTTATTAVSSSVSETTKTTAVESADEDDAVEENTDIEQGAENEP